MTTAAHMTTASVAAAHMTTANPLAGPGAADASTRELFTRCG
jgi:hypothetical protein